MDYPLILYLNCWVELEAWLLNHTFSKRYKEQVIQNVSNFLFLMFLNMGISQFSYSIFPIPLLHSLNLKYPNVSACSFHATTNMTTWNILAVFNKGKKLLYFGSRKGWASHVIRTGVSKCPEGWHFGLDQEDKQNRWVAGICWKCRRKYLHFLDPQPDHDIAFQCHLDLLCLDHLELQHKNITKKFNAFTLF